MGEKGLNGAINKPSRLNWTDLRPTWLAILNLVLHPYKVLLWPNFLRGFHLYLFPFDFPFNYIAN